MVYVYISVGQNYSHTLTHPLFSPVLKEKDTFESRETLKEAPICPEGERAEKGSGYERKGAKERGPASPVLTRPLGETLSPPDLQGVRLRPQPPRLGGTHPEKDSSP